MKIPGSVRALYSSKIDLYKNLQVKVDERINSQKRSKWHYESRVKKEQSFALKIETGRIKNLDMIEDFFACTIVVENQNEIALAIQYVEKKFDFRIEYRRPYSNSVAYKPPDSFRFDDLRLYVTWQDRPGVRPSVLQGILFEIQIKTYLQHAWVIATHDLVYKSDAASWPKKRIAFQIKAMLEHAEVAISEANHLSKNQSIKKTDKTTQNLDRLIKTIKYYWDDSKLPKDLFRLAENVSAVMRALKISHATLSIILHSEYWLGRGAKIHNLSPYCCIVQSIINSETKKTKKFLKKKKSKVKILITEEMDIPNKIRVSKSKNLLFV